MPSKLIPVTLVAAACLAASAQTSEEGIRQLWNQEFLQKRPAARPTPSRKPIVYKPARLVTPAVASAKPADPKPTGTTKASAVKPSGSTPAGSLMDTLLGVTLWRLRPPRPADDPNSRLLILEDEGEGGELVPERLNADETLAEGDRVRLTIEVPRSGHLYVIDREQYVDGTTSAPYLIYPNWQTRPGENVVAAGRVLEIPDSRDRPNHFRVRPGRADQVAELFSMLVTPEPLADLKIGRKPFKLSEEQYKGWETSYAVDVERFELEGGAGTASTKEEIAAAAANTRLTQDDPMPQTLYKLTSEPGKAILVKVPVKVSAKKR